MSVTFGTQDLTDLNGVKITGVTFPVHLPQTRHKVKIPGMSGSYDFGNNTAEDYEIIVSVLVEAANRAELRTRIIALGNALDGRKPLSIDDGPTSVPAQVYDGMSLDENMAGTTARGFIVFECDA